jgi:hypothetical protein
MTQPNDADSIETWLSALRDNVEPAPAAARQRLGQRLADVGLVAAGAGSAVTAQALLHKGLLGSRWLGGALWLPLGIVVGAVGHAWLAQPVAAPTPLARALPSINAPALHPTPPAVAVEAPQTRVVAPPPSSKARAATSAPEAPGLERELLLLEQARTRLSEGQATATLELLRAHRSQYPSSTLTQEREALAVKALVAAGRAREARQAAEAFVQRFPSSMLRSSVESAVRTIP